MGNPSPTLAIWLSLPGTSNWLSRPLDTRHLCLQGSWVLVVGVFPAAPLACCKMLLKFSPRSWSAHGPIRGILFFISTLGFSFKALGTSLILRCVERPGKECPGLSYPSLSVGGPPSSLHWLRTVPPGASQGEPVPPGLRQASNTAESSRSFATWLKDLDICKCVYKYIYMIELYFYSGILLGKKETRQSRYH